MTMEKQMRILLEQVAQHEITQGVMAMQVGADVDAAAERIAASCALLAMLNTDTDNR